MKKIKDWILIAISKMLNVDDLAFMASVVMWHNEIMNLNSTVQLEDNEGMLYYEVIVNKTDRKEQTK